MQFTNAPRLARGRRIVAVALLAMAATLAASAAPAAADPTAVGRWQFDEGDGQTVRDDGPLGLHGVLGSSELADGEDPLWIAGASGGALRFGASSYVHVADARRLDLPSVTVEVVARADASPGAYRYLVARGALGCFAGAYGLYTARDGGLAFYVFDGQRYFVSASAPAADVWDGAWHRLTGTFDGVTVRAFVDGREIGSALKTPAGTSIEYESMPAGTHFGNYVGSCRLPFSGELDSVQILSGADSPAAIAAKAGTTPNRPLAPAVAGTVIAAVPPRSSCSVRASRASIRTRRRAVVILRAAGTAGPLSRVRLSVRRAGTRDVLRTPRTNANGTARLVLKLGRRGRLRIAVVGRASCTPAFIRVAGGRATQRR